MELLQIVIQILAVFYLTKVLLYEDKTSHFGPFQSNNLFVYNSLTKHSQPVTLFDWVRRLTIIFNPYRINESGLWEINPAKIDRWTCPICLSVWVSVVVSFLYLIPVFQFVIFIFSVAGGVSLLFIWINK